jgi:hypothetical protein
MIVPVRKSEATFGNMLLQYVCETHEISKIKHLQHEITCCNIRLKQLKHLEHTVAIYTISRSKTIATYI